MDPTFRYLMIIRLVVIGGQCFGLYVMDRTFGVAVPWYAVSLVLLALALSTAFGWLAAGHSQRHYLLQSIADIAALSALIYLTGGSLNPFISLFLLPIVFAAAILRPLYIAGVTFCAVGSYTLLMFVPVRHHHPHEVDNTLDLHVWGMWYGFVLSAACVAILVTRISRRLRARDAEVAAAREALLNTDRMLALGTMATATAHELGTPLSTIALLVDELEHSTDREQSGALIARLREQLARSKRVLASIAERSGTVAATGGGAIDVAKYLDDVVGEWRRRRPEITLDFAIDRDAPAPRVVIDRVMTQAIVNVLDNAADAAVRAIEVRGQWTDELLQIDVRDDGAGISDRLRERIGHESVTTKEDGMGIGLLLSRSIIERLGGAIEFSNGGESGTHARLRIPLKPLLAD